MDKLLLIIIIAASGACAASSQVIRQYYFYYDAKTWTEALQFCREKHTDLATIDSMEGVNTLRSMADSGKMASSNNRAWIGMYDDLDSWRWSLSDPSFYDPGETEFRKWNTGEPDAYSGIEHCAIIKHGGWNDVNCLRAYRAICCDITGPNVSFVITPTPMTWTDAQSYCREHHTDLASVRNEADNQKVKEVVLSGLLFWIGLSRESWKWSDGGNSSFRYWFSGEPNNAGGVESCGLMAFDHGGKWEDRPCDYKKAFVCQTTGISKQVFRLSVQKKNPSLDLNDPAVMDDILEQIKQKLKDGGLDENIKLSWRKQPDGNVFQKVKTEEKKKKGEEDL
ncbi:macrophage mannose receptor 1-like [Notolabrus celidotus]|uniref:macrophage mannose receptor 1-like n=1 Tax=Notolabrus celidotus TaxID=1203425 RepID=UPI0014902014|nr:macrophage mannose receptor 1-like [Notolabrus celidotus]